MRTNAFARHGKRAAARMRAIRRRATEWKRRARRAVTLALITAGTAAIPDFADAQMGQMGMAPAAGLVNRAVSGFQELNANGPGWLYYGINAADRGLGYNGSYMTLGAYVPYSQDDLGGLWAIDARNHLSEYGGYFGNFGLVRKQFLGGSLLGIGVYYDYDADANQYSTYGQCGTGPFGTFGHVYNQVGVSGEWLTDFGNLRSNGYMPVGTTAYTAGSPDYAFYRNYVMCNYGLDAALSGADLEVGAYVPGLSDWAGMISVGGYALGNARYDWDKGPMDGTDVVPWFGGVYTRLDMTFLEHWDFSLQANNDSYFDWTGFARLTYRMGGSRRRNVPDQMEQPMMRNEHIVRAHKTPDVAINPSTGAPWRVIHVDNAAGGTGNGTAESPFTTLADGNEAATTPWDIVFVSRGNGTAEGYDTRFRFLAPNQSLIGDGAAYFIATQCCGRIDLATNTSGLRPLLSNPSGASIVIDGATAGGAVVSNFDITGSATAIYATGNLTAARESVVSDVTINGTGKGQTGVFINGDPGNVPGASDLAGRIAFFDTAITNVTQFGIRVDGPNAPGFTADYNGSVQTSAAENIVLVQNLSDAATVNLAVGQAPAGSSVPNQITATGGGGIRLQNNKPNSAINIDNVSLTNTSDSAIRVLGDSSTSRIEAGAGTGISRAAPGAAIEIATGTASTPSEPKFTYIGPVLNARAPGSSTPSYLLSVDGVGPQSDIKVLASAGDRLTDNGDGISIAGVAAGGAVEVRGATIASVGGTGILVNDSSGRLTFDDIAITDASNAGIALLENNGSLDARFANLQVTLPGTTAIGFLTSSSVASTYAVSVGGPGNVIATTASTAPAISIEAPPGGLGTPTIDMQFSSVVSGVAAGTNSAMIFGGSVTGDATVTSNFSVNGGTTKGTVSSDVTTGGATVIVPP